MSDDPDAGPGPDGDRPVDGNRPADGAGSTGVPADDDPFDALPEVGEADDDPFDALPGADGGDPFERLEDGADPGERTPAEAEALFESVDAGTTDDDSWEELVSAGGPVDGSEDGVEPAAVEETVVPKRRYCQDCEYLTAPPGLACTHADGEILEVVDTDRFRVRGCPVVAHRRERSIHDDDGLGADD